MVTYSSAARIANPPIYTHTRTTHACGTISISRDVTILTSFYDKKMWPVLRNIAARYTVYLSIPFGFIGYYIEGLISNRYTPATAPVIEQREERLLSGIDSKPETKKHSPLEVNLPPSLSV